METASERRMRYGKQSLMFLATSFGYISVGMTLTWPNVFASDVMVNNSTLFGTQIAVSDWQMDMVGSMIFLGSLPGFLFAGWLVRALGRRWSMVAASLPGLMGATLISLALNMEMVLVGRFLEGAMFGMMGVAARTYIIEIADTDIRGSASVVVNLMMQVGSVAVLGFGIPLAWYQVSLISVGVLVCYCFLLVPSLPESPTFLIVTNRDEEAMGVLRRLRGPAVDVPKLLQDLRKQNEALQSTVGWGFLLQRDILKRELILFGLFLVANFTGVQVIKANTARMLASSDLALDPKLSAVLVTIILFVGNFLILLILDRVGRRRCLVLSLCIILIAYAILGTFTFYREPGSALPVEIELSLLVEANSTVEYFNDNIPDVTSWTWVPLACLMLAGLGQSMGSGPIPWILSPEYFPTAIRSQAMCICTLMGSVQAFASLQLYSPMQNLLTEAGLYWSYSCTAAVGVLYTLLFLKETSGESVG
ncbi:facilitated trehalose transporter Tret1-like [Penaeus japonicus]|uniref:facilitated trehalose transporter Tret1-like n=1 Tax=Penaeus japonicus TaxID=27405 RepID=UPI001C70EE88|nr:facilitated trehalose transporter Tret1-like [Penaeus japonicus]